MSLVEDVYLCDSVFKLWNGKGMADTAALCCYRCLWSWTSWGWVTTRSGRGRRRHVGSSLRRRLRREHCGGANLTSPRCHFTACLSSVDVWNRVWHFCCDPVHTSICLISYSWKLPELVQKVTLVGAARLKEQSPQATNKQTVCSWSSVTVAHRMLMPVNVNVRCCDVGSGCYWSPIDCQSRGWPTCAVRPTTRWLQGACSESPAS